MKVTKIPARDQLPDKLRVAAYCRVSSDSADQLHSYATQIRSYTESIGQHEGWELVDVYADEGITGTSMEKRDDFKRMLANCRKGKIDKIVVKSISRFARNTRDCLAALRELSRLGVTVTFEKENIDTGTLTTELMVSVSGALAQQESISISQNQRMSYQRRMQKGAYITNTAPFGYELTDGKNLTIVECEAEIVRWIFERYLNGESTGEIAQELNRTVPHLKQGGKWYWQTIQKILVNEKYIGDSLCQKTYATGAFPFVRRVNKGEVDKYYTEGTHPPIISRADYDKVQILMKKRGDRAAKERTESAFYRRIICGVCGTPFLRRVGKSGYTVWVCRKHDKQASDCPMGRIPESELTAAFVRMYHKLKQHYDIIFKPMLEQMDELSRISQKDNPEILAINRAIAETSEQSYNIAKLHSAGLLDADIVTMKQTALNAKLTELRGQRRRLLYNEELEEQMSAIREVARQIQTGPEKLDGFDGALFEIIVEKIVADSPTSIRFCLHGGLELKETLREVKR